MATEALTIARPTAPELAARLERPSGPVRGYAVFAHCFTCGKESGAAVRISRGLAKRGIATLRFDVTGVGGSAGDFSTTTFSTSVDDLVAAAEALGEIAKAPALLIGHSLGGAAVIAAAERLPAVKGVVTIGAPADVAHVLHQLGAALDVIEREGEAEVTLGRRAFRMQRSFVENAREQPQSERIAGLKRALLVMHSPTDAVVGIENANAIFTRAKHPKSFVSLDMADHFLSRASDADYAASVIAGWAERILPEISDGDDDARPQRGVRVRETGASPLQNRIRAGAHRLTADEPLEVGGGDTGPNPYDLLAAALGACTSMTLRIYANRKGLPVERITVVVAHDKIHAADCIECETREGKIDRFAVSLAIEGPLDDEQRQRMAEIAARCPVHRTLHSDVETTITLQPASSGQALRSA